MLYLNFEYTEIAELLREWRSIEARRSPLGAEKPNAVVDEEQASVAEQARAIKVRLEKNILRFSPCANAEQEELAVQLYQIGQAFCEMGFEFDYSPLLTAPRPFMVSSIEVGEDGRPRRTVTSRTSV
jgi:hypothetical protein